MPKVSWVLPFSYHVGTGCTEGMSSTKKKPRKDKPAGFFCARNRVGTKCNG